MACSSSPRILALSVKTKKAGRQKGMQVFMKKEQLGELIIASEDTMYHVAKTLLSSDADCADAIQEAIVKAFTNQWSQKNKNNLYKTKGLLH